MTDMTSAIQKPGLTGVAPTYTAVTASDTFTAKPNTRYMLHYKCGATPTGAGTFKVSDPTTPIPSGSGAAAGFADAVVQNAGMLASTELFMTIDNSNRFRNSTGVITLTHTGTLTTVSVAVVELP